MPNHPKDTDAGHYLKPRQMRCFSRKPRPTRSFPEISILVSRNAPIAAGDDDRAASTAAAAQGKAAVSPRR